MSVHEETPMTKNYHTNIRRIHPLNKRPARLKGDFVLYWMTENRRLHSNHALDRPSLVKRLRKPDHRRTTLH